MNKKNINIESIIIYILLTYCVFQGLLVNLPISLSFIDELMITLLLIVKITKGKKIIIEKRKILLLLIYFLSTFFTIIIRRYYLDAYIIDLIYTLKPFILIEILSNVKVDKNNFNKYIRFLKILNIFSIIFGFYQYYLSKKGIFIQNGFYRENIYRIQGFSGHPANLANLSFFLIIYSMNKYESKTKLNNIFNIIFIMINIIAIYLSGARLILMVLAMYFVYHIYIKCTKKYIKLSVVILSIIIGIFMLINVEKILIKYNDDFENAIRFYAIQKIPKVIDKYPILGTGIGSFSTEKSIEKNSYVYNEFDFSDFVMQTVKNVSKSLFESNFAKQMIQTGLFGTTLYYTYFFIIIRKHKKNKIIVFWVCYIIFDSFLNVIYNIQTLTILGLLIAYSKERIKNE